MNSKTRLSELDCLRGIAALSVVLFHLTLGQPALYHIFRFGFTGVELFFVISGFVIFLTIEKTKDYRTFVFSRLARLYPAYWTCLTITFILINLWLFITKQAFISSLFKTYLINLTMFQHYFNVPDIDGIYWTLAVELQFYSFMLLLFCLKKIADIELIGFCVIIFQLIFSTFFQPLASSNFIVVYFPLYGYFPLFISGILFYKIKFKEFTFKRGLLIITCLIMQIFLFKYDPRIRFISQTAYAEVLTIIFLFFSLYYLNVLKFINNNALLFLGKISYCLYLIHDYTFTLIVGLLTRSKIFHVNMLIADFLVALPIVIVISALISKWIEQPAMLYLKKQYKSG